jgi:hypothetical protein
MIERALQLKKVCLTKNQSKISFMLVQAIVEMTGDSEFELEGFRLTDEEWGTLENYKEILQVRVCVQRNIC